MHRSRLMLLGVWNLFVFAAWLAGPFVLVGTVRWRTGWAYFVPLAVALVFHRVYVARTNPELVRHRRGIGPGTKKWDVAWNVVFWPLMACAPLAAGFGARVGASPMPWVLWPVGVGLLAGGFALSGHAMTVNPHFEGTVRVQAERSHRVVDAGPYRFVRHPGYVGLIL
jgi:protein-S-isoprenylcysteine O-methyltransferase Ste14